MRIWEPSNNSHSESKEGYLSGFNILKMISMREEYLVALSCATCGGEDAFETNEDQSYIKCTKCNREYWGGIEELKSYNQEAFDKVKEEIQKEAEDYLRKQFEDTFSRSRLIKL